MAQHPESTAAGGGNVCAVVVTFRPEAEVPGHLAALAPQVGRIIVIDNAATPASRALLAGTGLADYVANAENLGIAAALNQGVARARAAGFDWVATFDQDSLVPEGYIAGLLAALGRSPQPDRVAVLAPVYRDRHLGFVFSPAGPLREKEARDVPVSVTATSGNLVSVAAWQAVRGFREDYFIDCVDFEFCLRCRRAGGQILEVRSVVLEHAAGRWQQRRWLGKNRRYNDYSAERRYYQARNRVWLYPVYAGLDPRWVLRDAWGYLCDGLKLLLFCTDRWTKIRAMLSGIAHGLIGRSGPRLR
jgi:rhamnosyltransferase